MFSIIEHIEYLVARHDCVVVPGWGAFIANYDSAAYDEERSLLTRPCRTIGFNAGVTHNDGLLAQSLVRREGLSYDEAMRFINDSVAAFGKQLLKGSEVSMGRLGYFCRREDRYNEFVPFNDLEASDKFYGLADVEIQTITALERARLEADLDQRPAAIVAERGLFARKAIRVAASVAVVLGLGLMLSTPIIVDRANLNTAGMTPTVTAPQHQSLGVTVEEGTMPASFEVVESHSTIASVGNAAGKYYMVIATLRNQQELDAFKQKYAALVPHMKMLDYKGMMCVYVARSDDYSQLMSLRDELPEALRDIWIYN